MHGLNESWYWDVIVVGPAKTCLILILEWIADICLKNVCLLWIVNNRLLSCAVK